MDKVIIAGREDKGTKYCILENDGVGLCVCKHRPCEQLQRLEQENEELKADIISHTMCITCERELQNCNLQVENERLKAENEQLKKQYNCYACDSCGGKEDYINMKRHTENAIKTVHKYRQALQEIREIADIIANANCNYVIEAGNIIEKINEVIGAE